MRDSRGVNRVKEGSRATLALIALLALSASAEAKGSHWPTPAAGDSRSGDPEVIFTFDDGPHEKWSAKILDTLDAHGIQAIFYWVGRRVEGGRANTDKRRALVDRAVRAGHLIGNHTVHHLHLCHRKIDAETEIDHNDQLYRELAALPIVMFRTPYGDHCKRVLGLLDARGLTHMHWDIDPREWNGLPAEGAAAAVIARLKRLQGRAVVLMHDTHATTARALPRILTWIEVENERRRARGLRPIRVLSGSDLAAESGQGPLWLWGEEAAATARGWLGRSIGGLVPGALAGPVVAPAATAPAAEPAGLDSPTRTATLPQ